MGAHIEPALLAGELVFDDNGETLGQWDDHTGIDTPLERLADHAGIDLEQSAAALAWMRQQQREDVFEEAAELVGKMFDALIPRRPKSENLPKLETLGLKLLAARIMLNRDGTTTLSDWAQKVGVSKQLLSWHLKSLEDSTQLHWIGGKRFEARAVYSQATRERWAALTPEERKARRAGKQAAPQATPVANLTICND